MSVADFCFCAVVSEKALQAILDGHAQGIYRDNHPWIIAAERFHEAREKDRQVPMSFIQERLNHVVRLMFSRP